METETRPVTTEHLVWATLAAFMFTTVAAVFVVPWFGRPGLSTSDGSFAAAGLLGAAVVGWASWLGVERFSSGRPALGGAAAGVFTGVLAHPVAWFLWPLLPPDGAAQFAILMPLMSFWSLLFVGWITVPLGIAAGVATGVIRVAADRWFSRTE